MGAAGIVQKEVVGSAMGRLSGILASSFSSVYELQDTEKDCWERETQLPIIHSIERLR
jgi:hypothetical protein